MRLGQMDDRIIKVILISIGIVAFLAVISITYGIFQSNSPDMLNNCVQKLVLVSNDDVSISSKGDAEAFLKGRVGGEFNFVQNTLDVCPSNMGYMYNTTNGIAYVVCENGALYKYESVCTEGGKTKSLVSMLLGDKNAK